MGLGDWIKLSYAGKVCLIIGIISGLIAIYWFYIKVILPKFRKSKFKKLYMMLKDWFDEIDISLEKELNWASLNNKENKITNFIKDNKLDNVKWQFSERVRSDFLQFCGFIKELRSDKELFARYSRCPADGMYIIDFANSLFGSFYEFYGKYKNSEPGTNITNIEMRLKFLKMYLGIKEE